MRRIDRLAQMRVVHADMHANRIYKTNNQNESDYAKNRDSYSDKLNEIYQNWILTWKDVAKVPSFIQESLAGLTVAAVALPLNLALAVASGLPPSVGLLSGAIGGLVAAIFGGASLQVSGPAAALNLMVLAMVKDFGPAGAAAAALIVGLVQIILALFMTGKLIRYVPEAILAGFMTGVGLKLLDGQIPVLLGFNYKVYEMAQMILRPQWLKEVSWLAFVCGLFVAFLVISTKNAKRFPAALVGVALVSGLSVYLDWGIERVGAIDTTLPNLNLPAFSLVQWQELIIKCIPLALLASAESLLASSAIDRITKAKKSHDSNLELIGQGLANATSGLFSGMPVTGVIVRSTVNIQAGGKSKLAAVIHSAILLFSFIFLAEKIAVIPLAGLAGLLCVVGFRLLDMETLTHLFKESKWLALAFIFAMIGTVSGYLISGLLLGGVLCSIHYLLNKKKNVRPQVNKTNERKNEHDKPTRQKNLHFEFEHNRKKEKMHEKDEEEFDWLRHLKEKAQIATSAFIHNQASVIGKVVLGDNVHIAAGASVRADEGTPFYIGDNSNIQDGVVIHALKERWISVAENDWAVYVGKNVSMAHQALIHGPSYIGDNSFIGFKAIIHDSIIGSHCYIGIGAIVVGVEIPNERYVPNGMVVDSLDKVDKLPRVSDQHLSFNEDVVEVNKGLVVAYNHLNNGTDYDSDIISFPLKPSGPSYSPSHAQLKF